MASLRNCDHIPHSREVQTAMSKLAEWRRVFLEVENNCPWPGPRPLQAGDDGESESRQLRGRDHEVSDLAMACVSNHVVVLHGQSGVGKSSIINAGLVPTLKTLGKTVILQRTWGISAGEDPSDFITKGHLTSNPFGDGYEQVDRDFPNSLVFILDQFEELIRNDPASAQQVLSWIEDVAGKTSARFVISLRSEYEYQLRDLHTKPFTKRARIEIQPIENPATIRAIIGGQSESDRMPIEEAATNELCDLWEDTRTDESLTRWSRPGLLHLQATLYVLWMMRGETSGGPQGQGKITLNDVVGMKEEMAIRTAHREFDDSIFGYGLERSVEVAIANCERACDEVEVSRIVKDQTRWIFRDITGNLASGGYKIQQDIWELARRVLAYLDEPLLRKTPDWARKAYQDADWLGTSACSSAPDAPRSAIASGPAATLSDGDLLFELYRCYFFALEWMRLANIVQVLPSGTSFRVTLTHDRFSEGLASWRESQGPDFREAAYRFIAHRGKSDLAWDNLDSGLGQDRLVSNVRWTQCVIRDTEFRDVTFVNCDFAGSTFDTCTFAGIVFVNCIMDDVDFVECTVDGNPAWSFSDSQWDDLDPDLRRPLVEEEPTFYLEVSHELRTDLAAFGGDPDGNVLVSPPSGGNVASLRQGQPPSPTVAVAPELPTVRGGLVMCGGRLSCLTFRRCDFNETGRVVLRHIAGTSLEICEQTHGAFDIFAAAIRGLVVTRPVGTKPSVEESFRFDVRHAKMINTWLGVDLIGRAQFHDCNVWQLLNASEDMTVEVTNSAYVGLINAQSVDEDSLPLAVKDLSEPADMAAGEAAFTQGGLSSRAVSNLGDVSAKIDSKEGL